MRKVSVVLPAHNEEKNLPELIKEIKRTLDSNYLLEIIIVDDGSTDGTVKVIKELTGKYPEVKGIILYKNFGHQPALLAGINKSTGAAVVTMDSDFQHPPSVLPEMIQCWEGGSDLVLGQKKSNKETSPVLNLLRKLGYTFYTLVSDTSIISGVSDFRLMDRILVNQVKSSNEKRAILRSLALRYAKTVTIIPYDVGKRRYGKSSYTYKKLYNLFVSNIVSSSLAPLRAAGFIGLCAVLFSVLFTVYVLIAKFVLKAAIIQGWATTVILISMFFGLLFLYLGILAEYVGVIFDEVKSRPRFIVAEELNF